MQSGAAMTAPRRRAPDLSTTPENFEAAEERAIVERAQAGSVAAFEILVRHYQPRLLRYLVLRNIPADDAEDVIQATLIAAWRYLDGYRAKWRFSTWLYTIAQRNIGSRAARSGASPPAESQALPCDAIERSLRDTVWSQARARLDPDAFQALWLHHGEGFTGREIARILGRSPVWVRVSLHRSRNALKRQLGNGEAA